MKPDSQDRISKYLSMLNSGMIFDELSDSYLEEAGVKDILKGVPVPVAVDENGDMTTLSIILNMAKVVGGDRNYPYVEQYLEYIRRIAGEDCIRLLLSSGAHAADEGNFEEACMFFRAALLLEPKSADALYLYGRAAKEAYENCENDEEYVGSFKAESLEAFELLTIMHPDFSMGYYFLGYAYLNLGLYTKAELTWRDYLKHAGPGETELISDISERLDQLADPVRIENACNRIMGGAFLEGKQVLEEYKEGNYQAWWPLWYYLGIADTALGNTDEAIADLKKALSYSPSNIELMDELASLYKAIGDDENVKKYTDKIEIVRANMAEDENLSAE